MAKFPKKVKVSDAELAVIDAGLKSAREGKCLTPAQLRSRIQAFIKKRKSQLIHA